MKKKLFPLVLALAMVLALLPATAFAADPKPVTDGSITFSDVIVTDKYDTGADLLKFIGREDNITFADEVYYNLGMLGDQGGEGFAAFWTYIVPDDAVITFDTTEEKDVVVFFYTLQDVTEAPSSSTWYEAAYTGDLTYSSQKSWTLTKAHFQDPETWQEYDVPDFDLIQIRTGEERVNVMFYSDSPLVPSFTDLLSWCDDEAVWAARQKITNGYGASDKFAPGVDCTQVQILTFLWRAENKPSSTATAFSKLAGDYAPAANWAYEKGMIDDSFNPDAPCTRSQAVSYIWQAQGKIQASQAASFSDIDTGASYIDAVSWAVEKGITKGYGGNDTFAPDRVCSRGEIVCFLYRAYND